MILWIGPAMVGACVGVLMLDRKRKARNVRTPLREMENIRRQYQTCADDACRTKAISIEFPYYPGKPKGYAEFTEYTAMLQTIDVDLIGREAEWQFETLGLAKGFLSALRVTGERCNFSVAHITEDDAKAVIWLALMQSQGVDNAPSSTSNLNAAVQTVARDMCATGPCRTKFWDSRSAGANGADTICPPERLSKLVSRMRRAEKRGEGEGFVATPEHESPM